MVRLSVDETTGPCGRVWPCPSAIEPTKSSNDTTAAGAMTPSLFRVGFIHRLDVRNEREYNAAPRSIVYKLIYLGDSDQHRKESDLIPSFISHLQKAYLGTHYVIPKRRNHR